MSRPASAVVASLLVGCTAKEAPTENAAPPSVPAQTRADPDPSEDDILRAVLTDERFAMYLHPDVPGRVPVVLCGPARPQDVDLELFGAPVGSKDDSALDEGQACVALTQLSVEGETASVKLRYPVEGIVAAFGLAQEGEGWAVRTAEVVER